MNNISISIILLLIILLIVLARLIISGLEKENRTTLNNIVFPILVILILFISIFLSLGIYDDFSLTNKCTDKFGAKYTSIEMLDFTNKVNCCAYEIVIKDGYYQKQKICHGLNEECDKI